MKIGFDAKRYFHNSTGLGNYSRDLVKGLCQHFPDNEYFLYDKNPDLTKLPPNAIAVVPLGQHILWRAHGIIKDMQLYKLDVFHGLSNELPYGRFPKSIKKVVTIHDVIFRSFPEHYALIDRTIYDQKSKHAVKVADIVIATSQATAYDLIKFYKADERKIKVIYQSCGEQYRAIYTDNAIETFRTRHHLQQPYLLYVSSFQTRKNHVALIKAFASIKQNNTQLVLAGRKGETYYECVTLLKTLGLENKVNLVDDISTEDLPLLYHGAQGFIYPSMIEGFGIPLIEAACTGLPIAVNDIPVFREIAPEGTLFFDVNQQDSMVKALQQLLEKDKTKTNYTEHLKQFDAGEISKKLMAIYG